MSLSAGPGGRPSGEPDARGRSGGLYRKARGRLAARSYHRAMRTPRSLALPASWDVTGAAAGPAMTVLVSVVTRIAAALRVIGIGYVMLQVIIWHSFYAASPWLLWGPAVTVGWGALAAWYLRRRPRRWPLVCLDSAVYAGLALSASGCVPLAIRGQPGNWLFIVVTTQLIVPIWFAPAVRVHAAGDPVGGRVRRRERLGPGQPGRPPAARWRRRCCCSPWWPCTGPRTEC